MRNALSAGTPLTGIAMDPSLLVYPAVALMFATALVQAQRKSARRLAGLTAVAQRLDMTSRIARTRLGGIAEISLLAPQDGLGVVARLASRGAARGSAVMPGEMLFTLPEPRFSGGLAVFSRERATGMGQASATLAGALDNPLARPVTGRIYGAEIGDHIGELRDFPSARAPGLMILATVDPEPFFDSGRIAAALAALPDGIRGRRPPMLLATETGLQLRIPFGVFDPDAVCGIIATLRSLARDIRA